MNVRLTQRRGNAVLVLLAFCLALGLACVGMYFLMHSRPQESPSPEPVQAAAPLPEPTVFDPLPVVKERTGKAISNGAKAELIGSWQGSPPVWTPESPGSVKLTLKHGKQNVELSWKIENGEAKPANKLAEQLEAWTPGKDNALPAFLAASSQPVEETVTAAPPRPQPATGGQEPARNGTASEEWRDDGDPTRITNADLPPAAFAPKKPKAEKPDKNGKPTKPEMGSAGNLRLMGVMDGDGGTRAILNQGGEYVEVKVGENVGSYRVESINGKEVVLDKNGTRVRVSSDTGSNAAGGPPPKPTKPEPPPRPEMPARPSMTIDQDLEVPPIEEPVFDPGPFDETR